MACKRAEEINLELLLREPDSAECGDFVAHCADCADCAAALQRQREQSTEITPKAPSIAVAGAAVVIIVVIALLALSDHSDDPASSAPDETGQSLTAADPQPVRASSQRISENGRLSVSLADLREGDVLALDLQMPDEARGEGPRQVRVVDAERQRRLDTTGTPVSGADSGLRIEIAPDWLRPGLYMIEVDTAEKKLMPLRRFVLELK
jgi:hypothetical protein